MQGSLTAERVRGDIDVLSRGGLGIDEFIEEAMSALRRAVPWIAACVATHDPATVMLTSGRKYGDLAEADSRDDLFAMLEYGDADPSSFRALALAGKKAVGMQQSIQEGAKLSPRTEQLIRPYYGYGDESRMLFRDGLGMWGGVSLFRGPDDSEFSADEVAYLATLSEFFARGVRCGMLVGLAETVGGRDGAAGPAVIVVDTRDEVVRVSHGADERLEQLNTARNRVDPFGVVYSLVHAARALPRTPGEALPRARIRTPSGQWLALHASPLIGRDGTGSEVVVTVEEARPPDIVDVVVAAFGLTARERDVTRLVLRGVETSEIATTLHLSPYTVQDHLKSVFDKAGVRSRRELLARVYFDQYVPRIGRGIGPSGWFAD